MSKLYIFGIGGTGSRVLKSLTMLLASGVECGVDAVVPIIIDPDVSAGDLTRGVESIEKYIDIRSKLEFNDDKSNKFFRTEIKEDIPNFRLKLDGTQAKKFKDYMGVSTMSSSNQALMHMLFSDKNLESDMQVGFKGNPNVGSIVLNQFEDSQEFKDFANSYTPNDKIFIISSIFGGTGASGFPLLAKILRGNHSMPNFNIINNAQIGAISVLPYFIVKADDKSEIDSGTFTSKTKAALGYYLNNISENNTVDSLYYIGDMEHKTYDNHEGGDSQKNNAHIVELLSALAIIDFSFSEHKVDLSKGINTLHKEYGFEKDAKEIIFSNLGSMTRSSIQTPLTQFVLFCNYFKHESPRSYLKRAWAIDAKIDASFTNGQYMKTIHEFQQAFYEWLEEMENNTRTFSPYELTNINKAFEIVKGEKTKKVKRWSSNYALFDSFLNSYKGRASSKEMQIIELFYDSTKRLVDKKYNF